MCAKACKQGTPEERLKRFLYISNDHRTFASGDAEFHGSFKLDKLGFIREILQSKNPEKLVNIVEIVNGENALTCRNNLFVVLAAAVSLENDIPVKPPLRNKIYTAVLGICRDDEDFFAFIKYVSVFNKSFSSGIIKLVRRYYFNKEPEELAASLVRRKGYHGWTHKDLLKLSHYKTEDKVLDVLIKCVLFNVKKAEEAAEDNKEAHTLLELFKKAKEMRNSKDENSVLDYMKDLKFDHNDIPCSFIKSTTIWEHFLDTIDIKSLIKNLPHFYKSGLLKADNPCLAKTVAALNDVERVKASKISPIEAFIGLKIFEKGGKPKDAKLIKYLEEIEQAELKIQLNPEYKKPDFVHVEPFKCPQIVSALNKTLMLSYQNVVPTGKRYLITVEISEAMDKPCLTTRNVTALEAAVILVLTFLKSEKNVTVGVFNGASITTVNLDKGGSVAQSIKKLKEAEHSAVQAGASLEWAKNKKKPFDVFINLHSSVGFFPRDKPLCNPVELFGKYKSAMNMSIPKLIICSLTEFRVADYENNSILDVRGFSAQTPAVIDAFTKNLF